MSRNHKTTEAEGADDLFQRRLRVDTQHRPLSQGVADRFTEASQKRGAELVGEVYATGALVPDFEYRIEYQLQEGQEWRIARNLGEIPFRTAVVRFQEHNTGWTGGRFRLARRPVSTEWTVVMTDRF